MRQLPLDQVVHKWIQTKYVQEVSSCKCQSGLLYNVVIAELGALKIAFHKASKVEIDTIDVQKKIVVIQRHPKNYEDYVQYIINHLTDLLFATPTEFLNNYIPMFEHKVPHDEVNLPMSIDGGTKESLSDRLVRIMRYDKVRKKIAPHFFKELGVKTCVYCNANYAVTDSEGNAYYDIDHWKPKALYPYLCISFFNMQPSCPSCNRRKSDSDEKFFCLWNDKPGTDLDVLDFELSYFSYVMYCVFGVNEFLNVSLVPSNPYDADNVKLRNVAEKKFHIESRYKEHNDITEEIVWKSWIYSPGFLLSLRNAFKKFGFPFIDVGRFILGNYIDPDDIHKRPLSRMTQDVAHQLGII